MYSPARPIVRRHIVLLLLGPLVLSGCVARAPVSPAASTPSSVERPPLDNNELPTWRHYYANQFKVYAYNALEPTDYYPENAEEAYRLEQRKWMTERAAANRQQRRRETFYARLAFVLLGLAGYGVYALVTGQ
ncbi:hypothetical protein CMK11_05625 [Candidatus Poribacteria bacterium]|nr:hypothetical protein [Candidatus Poribacteria bacterium]